MPPAPGTTQAFHVGDVIDGVPGSVFARHVAPTAPFALSASWRLPRCRRRQAIEMPVEGRG